jgi:hypothetical protein
VLKRGLVFPPGDDQPLVSLVGGTQQFETFEAILIVHRTGSGGEPPREFVSCVVWHGDGIDLDNRHDEI